MLAPQQGRCVCVGAGHRCPGAPAQPPRRRRPSAAAAIPSPCRRGGGDECDAECAPQRDLDRDLDREVSLSDGEEPDHVRFLHVQPAKMVAQRALTPDTPPSDHSDHSQDEADDPLDQAMEVTEVTEVTDDPLRSGDATATRAPPACQRAHVPSGPRARVPARAAARRVRACRTPPPSPPKRPHRGVRLPPPALAFVGLA